MIALIDGDILRYRCGFSAEHTFYDIIEEGLEQFGPIRSFPYKKDAIAWINGEDGFQMIERKEVEPISNALHSVKISIQKILSALRTNQYKIYLSGKGNFRLDVATLYEYKGNRPDRKPVHYDAITEYLLKSWKAQVVEGQEADDALGIEQFNCWHPEDKRSNPASCICTIDKDLDMIPGWHYNFVNDPKPYWIDKVEGIRNFYRQLLKGDRVDNIPGLYWLTGKKVDAALLEALDKMQLEEDMWAHVVEAYRAAGLKDSIKLSLEEVLTEVGQLLWIRREENEIWQPLPMPDDS